MTSCSSPGPVPPPDAGAPRERARHVRFLSLSFGQPLGGRLSDGGYHLDLRVKAPHAAWVPPHLSPLERQLWVVKAQWGLGAFEHFVHTGDERWLAAARSAGDHVLDAMDDGGALDGALRHPWAYPHTFRLDPGWISAMAQGEAASLLVRLHRATGDERYAAGGRRLLGPVRVHVRAGGAGLEWHGGWWPEEYPTDPPSFVLNGGVFAILGMVDVADTLGDDDAVALARDGLAALVGGLRHWDLGWWSRYDLYPFRMPQVASLAYHDLHVDLLLALDRVRPHPALRDQAQRFAAQRASRIAVLRAMAAKVAFRLAVPRTGGR
jgi:hypothetical protein